MKIIKEGYSKNVRTNLCKKINEGYKEMDTEKKKPVKEAADPQIARRIKLYRELANLDESAEITEDNIDDWALNAMSAKMHISYPKARQDILSYK